MSVRERLAEIARIGTDPDHGGFSRHLLEPADLELRQWFRRSAIALGLTVETDGNSNLWAWWGTSGPDAVATGSHLDSVPGGGAFDGPLGVASAFEAVSLLQTEGWAPTRPVVICAFAEEEGSRFGVPCLGSRLLTGEISADAALGRVDRNGVSLETAWREAGLDPSTIGKDVARLALLGAFVELHVEQGLDLEKRGVPIAVASSILAHGRWRLEFTGSGNHAGTTPMGVRRDPVVAAAAAILAARGVARSRPNARATVGRLSVIPNGTNVIASRVSAWLDIRGDSDEDVREHLETTSKLVSDRVTAEGCELAVHEESFSPLVAFDRGLTARIAATVGEVPSIPTGAGHDAGVLASYLPTAMLFVRNPTGVSHAPDETARDADCEQGASSLAAVLRDLAGRPNR